jgi:glutathione S-transferase
MKLYDFPFSPSCRKVRAVAYELAIPLEHVHVDLLRGGGRTAAHLALNPNGRVPVIQDGDFVLRESTAILRYLAAFRENALVPTTARGAADMERWLAWQLAHLSPAMSKVGFERIVKKPMNLGAPDEAAIAAGTTRTLRPRVRGRRPRRDRGAVPRRGAHHDASLTDLGGRTRGERGVLSAHVREPPAAPVPAHFHPGERRGRPSPSTISARPTFLTGSRRSSSSRRAPGRSPRSITS